MTIAPVARCVHHDILIQRRYAPAVRIIDMLGEEVLVTEAV